MRVLFVGSNLIGDNSATGNTIYNITKNIDEIEILQYCIDYDPQYHIQIYKTLFEDRNANLFFYIIKKMYRKAFKISPDQSKNEGATQRNQGKTYKLKMFLRMLMDNIPHHIGERKKDIVEFNPDIIYSLCGDITNLCVVEKICRITTAPLVIHFMDDWYNTEYTSSRVLLPSKRRIRCLTDRIIRKHTKINLCISEKMAKEYTNRFHSEFSYAMNSIDSLHFEKKVYCSPYRIVFSGGLHGGRNVTLLKFAKAIKNDPILKNCIELHVFTSSGCFERYSTDLKEYVTMHQYVPADSYFQNLQQADFLLHVESFDEDDINFFKYSLSTKIPEYLSVGRPIICYGPKNVGTVEYLNNRKLGIVSDDVEELIIQLKAVIGNDSLIDEISHRCVECAKNHLSSEVSLSVYNVFKKAVRSK